VTDRRFRLSTVAGRGLAHARREAALLVVVLLLVVGVWAFVELADEVREGETQPLDVRVLTLLRRADDPARPVGPDWLANAARDVTALGGAAVLVLVLLAVLGYLALERRAPEMVLVAVAAGGGLLVSTALKLGFDRARPDAVPHLASVGDPSFPSGHSMLSAVVYLTLGTLLARIEARRRVKAYILGLAMLLAGLVGLSRVYLGVHYPTDVLAGWTAGLVWALGCWAVARVLQRRGAIAGADPRSPG
jgi:undecaprenyl-diphosphatase